MNYARIEVHHEHVYLFSRVVPCRCGAEMKEMSLPYGDTPHAGAGTFDDHNTNRRFTMSVNVVPDERLTFGIVNERWRR